MSQTHGFPSDMTKYSENMSEETNNHSVFGKIKRQKDGTNATECPRKGFSLGVKISWTCQFTSYSLGIISETSGGDYINYE